MSFTGQQTNSRSLNGIIEISDGVLNIQDGIISNIQGLEVDGNLDINGDVDIGGTLTAGIIKSVNVPVADDDITNKLYVDNGLALKANITYVDSQDALKLNLTGGDMTGPISMGNNYITNVVKLNFGGLQNNYMGGSNIRRETTNLAGVVKVKQIAGETQQYAKPFNNPPIYLNGRPSSNTIEVDLLDMDMKTYNPTYADYLMNLFFEEI